MMKKILLLTVVVLATFVASAVMATTVSWDIDPNGDSTTYIYTFYSEEVGDLITSFHVYAPMDPGAVIGWDADLGWAFEALPDEETGGADLRWYAPDPLADSLAYDQSMTVSVTVPAVLGTADDFLPPGCLGNWGYETMLWGDYGVLVNMPSIPVPEGAVPEPGSLIALLSGFAGFGGLVWKRRQA